MNNFELHHEFYSNPILLTRDEQTNPISVIRTFFENSNLFEARICLYNLLEMALTRPDTIYDDTNERDFALHFIKQLLKLIETTTLLTAD